MVPHMKTTLNVDDTVMAQLKREATRQGRTMSELVAKPVPGTEENRRSAAAAGLPNGGALVDIADREALYHAMEGR